MTTRRQFLQGVIAGAVGAAAARVGLVNAKVDSDGASRTVLIFDENGQAWGDAEYTTPTGPDVLYFDAPSMSKALERATDAQLQQAVADEMDGAEVNIANRSVLLFEPWGIKSEQVRDRITELREGST